MTWSPVIILYISLVLYIICTAGGRIYVFAHLVRGEGKRSVCTIAPAVAVQAPSLMDGFGFSPLEADGKAALRVFVGARNSQTVEPVHTQAAAAQPAQTQANVGGLVNPGS